MKKLTLVLAVLALFAAPSLAADSAKEPIKIGDTFAYTALPEIGLFYKRGWEEALKEVNFNGGILGRSIKVISRDHGDTPDKAVLVAQDLVDREKVDVMAGTIFAHVTNAVANYTGSRNMPLITLWNTMPANEGKQNDTMFSLMTTEAESLPCADFAATLNVKKWATIAPNFAYGRLAVKLFKERLKQLRPDVEFVDERWPTVNKIDASSEVSSLLKTKPEAIYSTLFTSDLTSFIRAGNRRNLFDGKIIIGQEAGTESFLHSIGKELRGEWYATGDPNSAPKNDKDKAFFEAYQRKFGSTPEVYTYSGYLLYKFIFAAIEKAGSTDPDKLVKAMEQVSLTTPLGEIRMNPQNHRSNFGAWFGRLQPTQTGAELVDWEYKDATAYLNNSQQK